MTTNSKWEPTHDLQLITLHKQELSVRGIAEQMGFSRTTVSRHGKRLGLVFDQRQRPASSTRPETPR
ncbi:winged helix-turn-helix domain-containing protein [Jonesiaceae bacterium BS-20]|uniref:Winged helix-turn-helix domain-containing protein n=1 Tax=Jonesiaceae bacterium BS-20 TaxID=3120821 RepID=A0AAU7DZA1_9MICO